MACPSDQTPTDRIISFNARYVLNGQFSGSVLFSDTTCLDGPDCDEICQPIEVGIDATTDITCCDPAVGTSLDYLDDCYAESPMWLVGLLRSYQRNEKEGTTSSTASSYFDYLRSKPISTQQFYGDYLSNALAVIFQYYTGTPFGLYDVASIEDLRIKGPVEGSNTYAELQTLAMAGCANLFVQVGGVLTIEKWKDQNDATEFVIPPQLIINAEPADYKYPNTSVITIRGSSLSKLDCGDKPISNNVDGPGSVKKCVIVGIATPHASVTFNNLSGNKEDILAARVISDKANLDGIKKSVEDGTFSGSFIRQDGGFFTVAEESYEFQVQAANQSAVDEGVYGYYYGPQFGGGFAGNTNFFNSMQNILSGLFPVPYSTFGLGAFGSQTFLQNVGTNKRLYSDQTAFQQIETVAISPTISSCGIKYEDFENKYVPNKERLFKLAVRRYQEMKLSQNTWNVEVPYIPCLKLNQMIEFTVPETEDCGVQVIKGIIGGIDIQQDMTEGKGFTTMRLAVMDVSCLGTTEYTSGNLINSTCAGQGASDLSGWLTSALDINTVATVSDELFLYATPGTSSFAQYTQVDMTIGAQYEWYFDYDLVSGAGFLNFTGPITTTLSGSGFQTGGFVAGSTSQIFYWELDPPPVNTYYRIYNLDIRKTVMG